MPASLPDAGFPKNLTGPRNPPAGRGRKGGDGLSKLAGILDLGAGLLTNQQTNMKITKVRYGEVIPNPCVNYANFKPEFEFELEDGEDPMEAIAKARELCYKTVEAGLEEQTTRRELVSSVCTLRNKLLDLQDAETRARLQCHEAISEMQSLMNKIYPPKPPENENREADEPSDDDIAAEEAGLLEPMKEQSGDNWKSSKEDDAELSNSPYPY